MRPSGSKEEQPRLVVIGNFDGVHLGHRAVLQVASTEAKARGLRLCVLTFDPHPAKVIAGKERPVLSVSSRKVELLKRVAPGLEVVVMPFTQELAQLTPEKFARTILVENLNAKLVLVGENFRFGSGRSGDLQTLKTLGQQFGFEARSEPLRGDGAGAFSSTRIRELLTEGQVESAMQILGRPHLLSGLVSQGDGRGRTIGFPTANLSKVVQALPQQGVYAVDVFEWEVGDVCRFLGRGVCHLGGRPTVDRPPSLEVHLLDFSGDLYGRTLHLDLLARIRGVERFDGIEALKAQISRDIVEARAVERGEAIVSGEGN